MDLIKPLLERGAPAPPEEEERKPPAELPQGNGVAGPLAESKDKSEARGR